MENPKVAGTEAVHVHEDQFKSVTDLAIGETEADQGTESTEADQGTGSTRGISHEIVLFAVVLEIVGIVEIFGLSREIDLMTTTVGGTTAEIDLITVGKTARASQSRDRNQKAGKFKAEIQTEPKTAVWFETISEPVHTKQNRFKSNKTCSS
jgi:hypothetical protein